MENEVLVIVPVYNEGENLKKVERDLKENFSEADILFIDDHSMDNSPEIIKSFEDVNYVRLPLNLGYFYAIQTGFKYATKYGYKYVVQFDGDGQHLAKEAKKIFKAAKEGNYDVTIGSRFLEETGYKHPFLRNVGTHYFRKLLKWTTGKVITDPTSGLQVLSRPVFSYLAEGNNFPETADANLHMELAYKGFSIHEEPVKMENRESGSTMHDGLIGPATYMIKMTYSMLLIYLNYFSKKND